MRFPLLKKRSEKTEKQTIASDSKLNTVEIHLKKVIYEFLARTLLFAKDTKPTQKVSFKQTTFICWNT
jgi:hypothetical protein